MHGKPVQVKRSAIVVVVLDGTERLPAVGPSGRRSVVPVPVPCLISTSDLPLFVQSHP